MRCTRVPSSRLGPESLCRSGQTGWSRISASRWQTHRCARRWHQSGGTALQRLTVVDEKKVDVETRAVPYEVGCFRPNHCFSCYHVCNRNGIMIIEMPFFTDVVSDASTTRYLSELRECGTDPRESGSVAIRPVSCQQTSGLPLPTVHSRRGRPTPSHTHRWVQITSS